MQIFFISKMYQINFTGNFFCFLFSFHLLNLKIFIDFFLE